MSIWAYELKWNSGLSLSIAGDWGLTTHIFFALSHLLVWKYINIKENQLI